MGNLTKTVVTFVAAVLGAAVVYLNDGVIDGHEWALLGVDFFTLVGVYLFPNTKGGENVNVLAERQLEDMRNRH